ncbi:hypothetical protein H2198_009557 [Neophaeococcomyces mojaviensis]|uniref:Uncharacterized protein n=1 Tax=Neophaeococcomyces mojaviensis TaxID=3383035 RepID=A0ACC2ZU04_9EURO|nr:hypothetical protein H2198_009557 [Knufia sp. JES_112]
MSTLLRVLREKWTTMPTPKMSLEGKTILITGTNTGLGFETAKKLAALGPKKLIITTRSLSKGEQTLKEIAKYMAGSAATTQQTEIVPLTLDMGTLDAVESFVKTLETTNDRLDGAILNAGVNSSVYHVGPDGYEDTIQVNAISTTHLAVLLLPLLTSTAKATNTQTHLTFISSRTATRVSTAEIAPYSSSSSPLKFMSQPDNFPPGMMGGQARYGQSKLLLEYAMRHLVQLPSLRDKNGKPHVIINSVCPGLTKSDLARNYDSWMLQLFVNYVFFPLLAKSTEQGANCYLLAFSKGEESYGQLSAAGETYTEEWDAIKSETGKEFGDKMWAELTQIMRSRVESSAQEVLGQA